MRPQISSSLSISPFDEEHVISDCDLISSAALRFQDKVIHSHPLVYVSAEASAAVLDTEDSYACILVIGKNRYMPRMETVNGRLAICWPQFYGFDGQRLFVSGSTSGDVLLTMDLCSEIYDLVIRYGA